MNLRHKMKLSLLASCVAAVIGYSAPATAQQPKKPNIVVIMCDDIGMWNNGA